NPYLRDALLECAWAASRRNNSQMQHLYRRLQHRLGHKRAIVAVAHALAQASYQVLSTRRSYIDTAEPPRSTPKVKRLIRHHTRRLRKLGYWLQYTTQQAQSSTEQYQRITRLFGTTRIVSEVCAVLEFLVVNGF